MSPLAYALGAGTVAPVDELAELQAADLPELDAAFEDFVRCVATAILDPSARNRGEESRCLRRLQETLATVAAFADVLGRARLLRELPTDRDRARAAAALLFAAPKRKPADPAHEDALRARRLRRLLGLGFDEATRQMIEAVPELARTREEITSVYERGGFALARSADLATTKAVQEVVAKAAAKGQEIAKVEEVMEALDESFTGAYSRLVFRNATTRAYAAGRMRQAREMPGVVGLEYLATRDENVRENHFAADGLIAAVDDPTWNRISPPNGMNCRCTTRIVHRLEAERLDLPLNARGVIDHPLIPGKWEGRPGALPPGAHPDEGGAWGRRADAIYRGGGLAG